jgi:hypothetical protein
MQGIAATIGTVVGEPAWTTTGDPCIDAWRGVTCDAAGYVTKLELGPVDQQGETRRMFVPCIYLHLIHTLYI